MFTYIILNKQKRVMRDTFISESFEGKRICKRYINKYSKGMLFKNLHYVY